MSENGKMSSIYEVLKSKKKVQLLPQYDNETCISDYNPLLFLPWKANMDVQFISEVSLTLVHYVTRYKMKAERSSMQDVQNEFAPQ